MYRKQSELYQAINKLTQNSRGTTKCLLICILWTGERDNEWIGLCLSESQACRDTLTDTQDSNQVENKSVLSAL